MYFACPATQEAPRPLRPMTPRLARPGHAVHHGRLTPKTLHELSPVKKILNTLLKTCRAPTACCLLFVAVSQLAACGSKKPKPPPPLAIPEQSASVAPVPKAAAAGHPIVGTWQWEPPGKACLETWQYSAQGTRQNSGARQLVQGLFEITPKPSLLGFYRLNEIITAANGQTDCSGNQPPAPGNGVLSFVQFSPALDQFIVCQAESLQACFGPFRRSKP